MNYQKIYQSIIDRARDRTLAGYTETHHILPRCLGGTDDLNNLVKLTPEEHYLAHQLLAKMHPQSKKLLYAAVMMCANRPSNKMYGWLRRRLSELQSKQMAGTGNSMYGKRWISNQIETLLVDDARARFLIESGVYIAGKKAVLAPCGCLVKSRCIAHENKRQKTVAKKNTEFEQKIRELFDEFMQSDAKSISEFAREKGMTQPRLSTIWKKYIPEYANVTHGKSFKAQIA